MAPCSTSIALHCCAWTAWHIVCCAYRRIALRIIVNAAAYPYTCDNHKNLCCRKKNRNHIKQRVRRQRRGQTKQKMQNACSSQFAMRFVVPALWLRRCFVCLSTANPNRRSVYGYLNGKCSVGGVLRTHTPAPGTIAPYIKHLWISDNLLNVNMVIIFYVNKWWAIGIYRLWHILHSLLLRFGQLNGNIGQQRDLYFA